MLEKQRIFLKDLKIKDNNQINNNKVVKIKIIGLIILDNILVLDLYQGLLDFSEEV